MGGLPWPESTLVDGRPQGVWTRLIGFDASYEGHDDGVAGGSPTFDYSFYALQLGADLWRNDEAEDMRDRAGIYGAFGHADGSVEHELRRRDRRRRRHQLRRLHARRLLHPHRAERLVRRRRAAVHLVRLRDDERPRPRRASTPTAGASPPRSRAAIPTRSATTAGRSSRRRSSSTRPRHRRLRGHRRRVELRATPTRSPAGSAPGWRATGTDAGADGEPQPRSVWGRVNLWRDLTGEPTTTFSAAGGPVAFERRARPVLGRVRGRRRRRRTARAGRSSATPSYQVTLRRRRRQHRRRARAEVPMVSAATA